MRLWRHIWALLRETVERLDVAALVVTVGLWVARLFGVVPEATALSRIQLGVILLGVVWISLWIPYRMLRIQFVRHESESGELRSRIKALEAQITPRLELLTGSDEKSPYRLSHPFIYPGNVRRDAVYLRGAVVNPSFEAVSECSVTLRRIEKDGIVLMGHEHRPLAFVPEFQGVLSKSISPRNDALFDILVVTAQGDVFLGTHPPEIERTNGQPTFAEKGLYFLFLRISGANSAPLEVRLAFSWTQNHKTSCLWMTDPKA